MTRILYCFALISATALMTGCAQPSAISGNATPGQQVAEVRSAPPTVQRSAKERLVQALETNGCVLNVNTVGAVLTQASINQSDIVRLVPELEAEGRAEVANDGEIRLLSQNCI